MKSVKASRNFRKHRNIYRFGGPWTQALSVAVPWVNAMLLVLLLVLVHRKIAVAPGVLFDLPHAPLREGTQATLTAMMIPVGSENRPGGQDTLVFFDDDRFLTSDSQQWEALSERLREVAAQNQKDGSLLLLADKRVPHGEVMNFVNLARESGVRLVKVGLTP